MHTYTLLSILWVAAFVLFLVLEAVTVGLFSIWFAFGALAAFITSMFCHNFTVQLIVFVIVSFVTLLLVRPIAKKKFSTKVVDTNTQALIGKKVVVTEQINNLKGQGKVMVDGMEWTARSADNNIVFPKNRIVVIQKINGVKVIVGKSDEEIPEKED